MRQETATSGDRRWADELATLAMTVQQEGQSPGGPAWRVRVRQADEVAPAVFVLASYEHVLRFEEGLESLGYEMLMVDDRLRYCDFVSAATARWRDAAP
jgi:hypothetical protein